MSLFVAVFIFICGFSVGILLAARRHYVEMEQIKSQARDYRLQAVALRDLCRRLDRVSQLQPMAFHREDSARLISPNQTSGQAHVDLIEADEITL